MPRRLAGALFLFLALTLAGARAAEFSLTDVQGQVHSLAAYRGKWVVVNLWATWCAPCLAEMPELEALRQSRPDLVVLGVAGDGQPPRRLMDIARKLKVGYPIIAGDEKAVQQLGGRVFPTTLVFDPAGRKALVHEGAVTGKLIEEAIRRQEGAPGKPEEPRREP